MGNRLLCLLTGLLYARVTGRRLVVDWRDHVYSSDGTNVFPHFFACPLAEAPAVMPESDSVEPALWRGHLQEHTADVQRALGARNEELQLDVGKLDHDADVLILCTPVALVGRFARHFTGPLAGLSGTQAMARALDEDLKLHPRIRERVDRFRREDLPGPTVAVHVRYADHRVRLWAILRALSAYVHDHPGSRVFLATDSAVVRDAFARLVPDIVTRPHWYAAPGMPAHTDWSRPDRTADGVEALIDLYLLAESDALVVDSSSSFARVAVIIATARGARVVELRRKGKLARRVRDATWSTLRALGWYSWGIRLVFGLVILENWLRRRVRPRSRSLA